jgi:hypothetical protein
VLACLDVDHMVPWRKGPDRGEPHRSVGLLRRGREVIRWSGTRPAVVCVLGERRGWKREETD